MSVRPQGIAAALALLTALGVAACHRRAPASADDLLYGRANPEALPVVATTDGAPFDHSLRARLLSDAYRAQAPLPPP